MPQTESLNHIQVTNPTAKATSESSLVVTWHPPIKGNFTGYHLKCSRRDPAPAPPAVTDDSAPAATAPELVPVSEVVFESIKETEARFDNLELDKEYEVEICVVCGDLTCEGVVVSAQTSKLQAVICQCRNFKPESQPHARFFDRTIFSLIPIFLGSHTI